MARLLRQLFLIYAAFTITSCASHKTLISDQAFTYNYCSPTVSYLLNDSSWQDNTAVDLSTTTITQHDQLLCQLLGISGYVNNLWLLKKDTSVGSLLKKIVVQQALHSRLLLAQSQLQAVAAELACEGERSKLASDYIDAINGKIVKRLTIGSVIAGALTTVATVAFSNKNTQTAVGVGGGLLSAGLVAFTISPKGKKIAFYHERNLLHTIWEEPTVNKDYPGFVWRMLHEKRLSNKGDITLAESIRSRWVKYEFAGTVDKTQAELLFGKGGFYRSDDLHTRTSMINQLQSTIRSLNQDFTSLVFFLESIN